VRAEPQRITVEQLISLLGHIRGCRIAIVHAETIPRLRQKLSQDDRTPCPWFNTDTTARDSDSKRWHIRKRTTFSVAMIGHRKPRSPSPYEVAVNSRRAKDWQPLGDDGTPVYFESSGRAWGRRRKSAPLVDYRGQVYLDIQRLRILSYSYYDIRTGRSITQTQLEPWLIGRSSDSHQQQTSQSVIWRDYRIDRIRKVTGLNGQPYEIARRSKIKVTRETRQEQIERRRKTRLPTTKQDNRNRRSRRRDAA
tara:strand:- start:20040 stop:20792 length:753 start_codon:yes stop_codon:yes gene_type:complete